MREKKRKCKKVKYQDNIVPVPDMLSTGDMSNRYLMHALAENEEKLKLLINQLTLNRGETQDVNQSFAVNEQQLDELRVGFRSDVPVIRLRQMQMAICELGASAQLSDSQHLWETYISERQETIKCDIDRFIAGNVKAYDAESISWMLRTLRNDYQLALLILGEEDAIIKIDTLYLTPMLVAADAKLRRLEAGGVCHLWCAFFALNQKIQRKLWITSHAAFMDDLNPLPIWHWLPKFEDQTETVLTWLEQAASEIEHNIAQNRGNVETLNLQDRRLNVYSHLLPLKYFGFCYVMFHKIDFARRRLNETLKLICVKLESNKGKTKSLEFQEVRKFPKELPWEHYRTLVITLGHVLATVQKICASAGMQLETLKKEETKKQKNDEETNSIERLHAILHTALTIVEHFSVDAVLYHIMVDPESSSYEDAPTMMSISAKGDTLSFTVRHMAGFMRRVRHWIWSLYTVNARERQRCFGNILLGVSDGLVRHLATCRVHLERIDQFKADVLYLIKTVVHVMSGVIQHPSDLMPGGREEMPALKLRAYLRQLTAILTIHVCPLSDLSRFLFPDEQLSLPNTVAVTTPTPVLPFEHPVFTSFKYADMDAQTLTQLLTLFDTQPEPRISDMLLEVLYIRNAVVLKSCAARLIQSSTNDNTAQVLHAVIWLTMHCKWDVEALGEIIAGKAINVDQFRACDSIREARQTYQQCIWYREMISVLAEENEAQLHLELTTTASVPITDVQLTKRLMLLLVSSAPPSLIHLGRAIYDLNSLILPAEFIVQAYIDTYKHVLRPLLGSRDAAGVSDEQVELMNATLDALLDVYSVTDERQDAVDRDLIGVLDHISSTNLVAHNDFEKMPYTVVLECSTFQLERLTKLPQGAQWLKLVQELVKTNIKFIRRQLFIAEPENLTTVTMASLKNAGVNWRHMLRHLDLKTTEIASLYTNRAYFWQEGARETGNEQHQELIQKIHQRLFTVAAN